MVAPNGIWGRVQSCLEAENLELSETPSKSGRVISIDGEPKALVFVFEELVVFFAPLRHQNLNEVSEQWLRAMVMVKSRWFLADVQWLPPPPDGGVLIAYSACETSDFTKDMLQRRLNETIALAQDINSIPIDE